MLGGGLMGSSDFGLWGEGDGWVGSVNGEG